MADFCMQCSIELFGEDFGDLSKLSSPEDTINDEFPIVICEGCGAIQVDHTGRCISYDCIAHHGVFVFGSNLAGIHGKGAAAHARAKYGALPGQGIGRQGQSYAIPTKNSAFQPLVVSTIKQHVDTFLDYAKKNPQLTFIVTGVGTGLAGYRVEDIAPFFINAPSNCIFLAKDWQGRAPKRSEK